MSDSSTPATAAELTAAYDAAFETVTAAMAKRGEFPASLLFVNNAEPGLKRAKISLTVKLPSSAISGDPLMKQLLMNLVARVLQGDEVALAVITDKAVPRPDILIHAAEAWMVMRRPTGAETASRVQDPSDVSKLFGGKTPSQHPDRQEVFMFTLHHAGGSVGAFCEIRRDSKGRRTRIEKGELHLEGSIDGSLTLPRRLDS